MNRSHEMSMNSENCRGDYCASVKVSQEKLRKLDRLSQRELLALIGEAIKADYIMANAIGLTSETPAEECTLVWMKRHAPRLVKMLIQIQASCSKIPLALRPRDVSRCVEAFEYVEWVPAPEATAAYVMRYARECPVLSTYLKRRPSAK